MHPFPPAQGRHRPQPPPPLCLTMVVVRSARVLLDWGSSAGRRRRPRCPRRPRGPPRMARKAPAPLLRARVRHRAARAARRVAAPRGARRDPHKPGGPALETGANPAPVGALPERARRVASSAEASARTVEAAIVAAAEKLGLRADQVEVEILKQPVASTFGKVGEAAVVRVVKRTGAGERSAAAEPVDRAVAVAA